MTSRRKFLQSLSAGSAILAPHMNGLVAGGSPAGAVPAFSAALSEGWSFHMDPSAATDVPGDEAAWTFVMVPHTWQALGGEQENPGVAWYRLLISAPIAWQAQHVELEFEAVTHTAHVFLNGKQVGAHIGKGYTAFRVDLSPGLHFGSENTLMVRVDNRPGNRMLPRNKSYDWADDGGIIRPVNLYVTPKVFINRVEVEAVPDLAGKRATLSYRVFVKNTSARAEKCTVFAVAHLEHAAQHRIEFPAVSRTLEPGSETLLSTGPVVVANPHLWHFDTPHLYTATIRVNSALGEHACVETFGIRTFEVRDKAFYLNGEKVSLIGVERMAGSHPDLGMAETIDWIRQNHHDLKMLNCVFTRVHWAQDRRVLDFCDRHGILMQEEVPAWGSETFQNTDDETQQALEQNGLEQLREMIARDRNHPCIVVWGLCNEVNGKNPRTRQFAQKLSAEARRLDPSRLQTYASHSLDKDPGADMAGDLDFISTNEYFGSWAPGGTPEVRAHLDRIRKAFPDKAIVVSEYGWCECQPKILPGDHSRVAVIDAHTDAFRYVPEVAGAIYFDYNDYRTLVGDKGAGAMRQRVHGVVDLYANRKPSFQALRLQSSPIESATIDRTSDGQYRLMLTTRRRLPAYTLYGYALRWVVYGYDDLPMAGHVDPLPDLLPGSSQQTSTTLDTRGAMRVCVDIFRPTGYSVLTVEYLVNAAEK